MGKEGQGGKDPKETEIRRIGGLKVTEEIGGWRAFARAAHGAQEALHVDVNGRVIDGRAEKDPLRVHLQAVVQASIGQGLERVERLPEALSARGLGQVGPEQINQGAAWMAATRLEH